MERKLPPPFTLPAGWTFLPEPRITVRETQEEGVINKPTSRPFPVGTSMSSSHLEPIRDWLEKNVDPTTVLGGEYHVQDLLDDLDEILVGMWSDGIDARGDDA